VVAWQRVVAAGMSDPTVANEVKPTLQIFQADTLSCDGKPIVQHIPRIAIQRPCEELPDDWRPQISNDVLLENPCRPFGCAPKSASNKSYSSRQHRMSILKCPDQGNRPVPRNGAPKNRRLWRIFRIEWQPPFARTSRGSLPVARAAEKELADELISRRRL